MKTRNLSIPAWFSASHVITGFVVVLVGYTSSIAIVFQAAHAATATPAQVASWLCVLGLGMGLTCIGLSLYFRTPIVTAWSTPGAAILVTGLNGMPMTQAVGVFVFCSLLIFLVGLLGWFDRLMKFVPRSLAAGMLAGVLLRFGINVFVELAANTVLVGSMLISYLLSRRFVPRFAVPFCLSVGLLVAHFQGELHLTALSLSWPSPEFVWPSFSLTSIMGVGIPLFLVTMASQNLPGVAVMRANGYDTPVSPVLGWTGLTGILLAPFGGFSFNFAAITAALCMSPDADSDPKRRYLAAVWAGIFYLIMGALGATVVGLFSAFPQALVLAIAGLALFSTIGNSLADSVANPQGREAAVITFLVTASGMSLWGIAAAFWGLLAGLIANALLE